MEDSFTQGEHKAPSDDAVKFMTDGASSPKLTPHPPGSFNDYPEGGARAWMTVGGASACLFVSFGWVNCAGIFQQYYQANQLRDYSPSNIAWIPAIQIFFMIFSGIIVGKIFDDHGPAILLATGTFLHVFGLMMISLSSEYYQILLSQAVCSGIGASMVFFPAFTSVSTWFMKKRGAALGFVVMGSSIGGVILPIMLIKLIPAVGFAWAIRICAFLILALLLWANIAIRSNIPPTRRPFELKALLRPLGELPFALLTAAIFFFYCLESSLTSISAQGGMFIPLTFIVVEARTQGMSQHLANYLVPILNGASVLMPTSIIGRTVPNALADKVGHYNMMITMAAFTTIIMLGLWLPASGNAAIIVFAVLFGIASGAGIGLSPVLIAHISPLPQIGARTGAAFSISALAALTGSPIGGAIVTASNGSFRYAKVFGGVTCGIGTLLFIASRIALAGWKKGRL